MIYALFKKNYSESWIRERERDREKGGEDDRIDVLEWSLLTGSLDFCRGNGTGTVDAGHPRQEENWPQHPADPHPWTHLRRVRSPSPLERFTIVTPTIVPSGKDWHTLLSRCSNWPCYYVFVDGPTIYYFYLFVYLLALCYDHFETRWWICFSGVDIIRGKSKSR